MDLTERSITLISQRDEQGSHYVGAHCTPTGDVVIEGQSLGASVSGSFNVEGSEYEFVWTVPARETDKLRAALGGGRGDDILSLLLDQLSGEGAYQLSDFFKTHEIAASFWSRVGD